LRTLGSRWLFVSAVSVLLLSTAACYRGAYFEYRQDDGCWDMDPSPPRGVDLSVCELREDAIVYAIDPDGDCWELESCWGLHDEWEGWRVADATDDAWCYEAGRDPSIPDCE